MGMVPMLAWGYRAGRHVAEAFAQQLEALLVERPYGPGQVAEGRGVGQAQAGAGVVGQQPGEHGPLGEVVEGAPRGQVAEQQVVKVGQAAALPGLRGAVQVRRLPLHIHPRRCGRVSEVVTCGLCGSSTPFEGRV